MSQAEQITPTTSRPTTPAATAQSTSVGSMAHQEFRGESDDESEAVLIASDESSLDDEESIISTSEVDWSIIRTRAESVNSDGSDDESTLSGGEESFDVVTPGHSVSLQSVPSRTTGTSGSVLSLEDAQSSINA